MARWIAFDDETAEAVVGRFKRGAAEIHTGEPVDSALSYLGPSILMLPSPVPGKVLMARIEPKTERAVLPGTPSEALGLESVGFLGLSDQPIFSKPALETAPVKKKWWQRRSA
jgi:hypothetical protein